MHIYCDFDGTISNHDATDYVLSQLADPAWEEIEQQWVAGEIDASTCMRRQIALINAPRGELDRVLDEIGVDGGFGTFLAFCESEDLPVTIVSDGVDYFIRRIISRLNLTKIEVVANHFSMTEQDGRYNYALVSPYAYEECRAASGVCKCRVLNVAAPRVYIGDGRSDFCVSHRPELVFAKSALADHCRTRNIPFIGYQDFHDVTRSLCAMLPALRETMGPQAATAA